MDFECINVRIAWQPLANRLPAPQPSVWARCAVSVTEGHRLWSIYVSRPRPVQRRPDFPRSWHQCCDWDFHHDRLWCERGISPVALLSLNRRGQWRHQLYATVFRCAACIHHVGPDRCVGHRANRLGRAHADLGSRQNLSIALSLTWHRHSHRYCHRVG